MGEVIRILHLSDFHLCPERRWDSDPVLKGLTKTIGELKDNGLAPDIVALTGDIADKGRPEDYAEARRWIDEGLRKALPPNFPNDHLLVIPGNHDVDRSKVNLMVQTLQSHLLAAASQDSIADVLQDMPQRDTMLRRHDNYLQFLRGLQTTAASPDVPWWWRTLQIRGKRLHVVGLCSTWLSWQKEEYGKLLVSRWQINEVLRNAEQTDWSVVLVHHPWSWLAPFDGTELEKAVQKKCHVIMRGHLHEQQSRAVRYPDHNRVCIELAAGAAYAGSRWPNAFQLAELHPNPRKVVVHFWLWKDDEWILDRNAVPGSDDGTATFDLDAVTAPAGRTVQARTADATKYLRALADETGRIKIRGLHVGSGKALPPFPIDEFYIPLTNAGHAELEPKKDWKRKAEGPGGQAAGAAGRIELDEALHHERRLVIIGDPGAGKTTFLNRIAYLLSRARLGDRPEAVREKLGLHDIPFPILIRVSELVEHISNAHTAEGAPTTVDSPAWLKHFLVKVSADSCFGLHEEFFRSQLEGGSAVVLLDGLDEAPTDLQRLNVSKLVRKAALEAFDGCRFVLTSRPAAIEGDTVLSGFAHVRIETLDDPAIESFLHRWCGAMYPESPTQRQQLFHELTEALRARPEIRRMARNSQMLTALAAIHWNDKRLPEQRAELYESILLQLARSREAKPGRPLAERCLALHQELAMAMQDQSDGRQVQVPRFWAAEQIASDWREVPTPKERVARAEAFLNQEELDSGIVVRRGDHLRFWHLTFQEYLAARALAADEDKRLGLLHDQAKFYRLEWKEVIRLLAGVLYRQGPRRVDAMFSTVLEAMEKKRRGSLSDQARCFGLLGAVVRDLSQYPYKPADPKYQKLADAVQEIFNPQRSPSVAIDDAIKAAEALGEIGDLRFANPDSPNLWVPIPGGVFRMGSQKQNPKKPNYDKEADDNELSDHPVRYSAYRIGKYPVTVAEYQRFVDNDGYADESHWKAGGFCQWPNPEEWDEQIQHSNRPVTGVSWFEAAAYAAWARCRLPSEAEWERAARGVNARKYPWGPSKPDPKRLNYQLNVGSPTPVGVYPLGATPDGILDMAGNVWEWCQDHWHENYKGAPDDGSAWIKGEQSGLRVLRGGAWNYLARNCRGACRGRSTPDLRLDGIGFRLAAGT